MEVSIPIDFFSDDIEEWCGDDDDESRSGAIFIQTVGYILSELFSRFSSSLGLSDCVLHSHKMKPLDEIYVQIR